MTLILKKKNILNLNNYLCPFLKNKGLILNKIILMNKTKKMLYFYEPKIYLNLNFCYFKVSKNFSIHM